MLKKLLFSVISFIVMSSFALAATMVDVNKADQTALDGIKGIGPSLSKTILAERSKGGEFKDWSDLENRVKGIGEKNSIKLSDAGLVVNGKPKNAPASSPDKPTNSKVKK